MFDQLAWRVRRTIQRLGLDVLSYHHTRHPIARRLKLFEDRRIDTVLDVGANGGQYGTFLRRIGFGGRIISFEPLKDAYRSLQQTASGDPSWQTRNVAIGEGERTATINVSKNSESSSFLPLLPSHLDSYPDSRYIASEEVEMISLQTAVREHLTPSSRAFLKVDAQGYETTILKSAGSALDSLLGVQLEMSLIPLYEGELLMPAMVELMRELGFVLMSIEPGSGDQTSGQLLQIDGLFFRSAG
jgi:FkbM family methyltransferase